MIAAVGLLAYAAMLGTVGGLWLGRATWTDRAPRLGILAWQAISYSVLGSVVLAGLVLAVPVWPVAGGDLAALLHTCAMLLRAQYSTPGGATIGGLGILLAFGVIGRATYCLTVAVWAAGRRRSGQRRELALVASADPALGVLVLDHPTCAAYCVPGRGGRVVITTGALAALDAEQVAAVSAHEFAHLRGRHDLVIQSVSSLHAAFRFVPAFAAAEAEVARLTEMLADDASCRGGDRLTLATALVRLAESRTPIGALGAGGSTAVARVRRLATPTAPLPRRARLAMGAGVLMVACAPFILAVAPAMAVVSAPYCPISMAS